MAHLLSARRVTGDLYTHKRPVSRDYRVRREKVMVHSGSQSRPGTGSFHPVAIRAAVEATRLLKPLVQKVVKRLGEQAGRNLSKR